MMLPLLLLLWLTDPTWDQINPNQVRISPGEVGAGTRVNFWEIRTKHLKKLKDLPEAVGWEWADPDTLVECFYTIIRLTNEDGMKSSYWIEVCKTRAGQSQ